ncbi:MAG: 50S ribosome-binding GTPase [Planctomycetia bacterium]|nr:50S ribosome-binding GTPase [Planctomycetia bacterium]
MTSPYTACAELVRQLHLAIRQLESHAMAMQTSPLKGREWFELLTRKLVPQLSDDAFLVVGVVGGTNIGKSVIFNHLAGCRASATSAFASGTKHPVCLVPPGFEQKHDLASIFCGFDLHAWSEANAALEDHREHRLFWRTNDSIPSNLLILDTPDIDGDVRVNWERADNIRRCADVLVAVLTQQKYNDAVVKQFFRKAAEEDKVVLVVFNQVLLPDDEPYWPVWLQTFCQETGINPEFVYVAPADRRAAEENRLPFYLRDWPLRESPNNLVEQHSLKTDLSALHFSTIKLRTLRGSLRTVLNERFGLPAYLAEVRSRSEEFRTASALLSTHELAESREWPPVPNPVVVQEVRNWWQAQREGWTKTVHNFYNALGRGMLKPFASLRDRLQGERVPPLEQYRQREWQTILDTVEKVYERLQWFSELGNPLLQPRIDRLLNGKSRVEMLELLKTRHDLTDLEFEVRSLIGAEMEAFRQESPQSFQLMKWIDHGAAAVRPVTSVCLFVTGFGPAGHAVQSVAANAAVQFAVDIASGTVTAVAGEKALSETAATGAGLFEAWFRRLHARFAAKRAAWLGRMLKDHLFGTLPDELQAAISIPQSEAFQRVQFTITQLQKEVTAADG